jgi:hypothetical protein
MDFVPVISPALTLMPAGIFREVWGELASASAYEPAAAAAALS